MKMTGQKSLLFAVLFVAAVLRLWRISSLTEFLGDQGRAGIVALDIVRSGIIPLAGPTTLTNQHLGPFFYYFGAVGFALSNFNPIGPAVLEAFIGIVTVFMVFLTIKTLVDGRIAIAVSALYAASPQIVAHDRILWEPNLVPFATFIWFYSCLQLCLGRKIWWWVAVGASLAILLQLHYFNLLFIGLTAITFMYTIFQDYKKKGFFAFPQGIIYSLVAFVILFYPFIMFEVSRGWTDIKEVFGLLLGHSEQASKREIFFFGLEYIGRMVGYLVPFGSSLEKGIAIIGVGGVVVWMRRQWWENFIFFWMLFGGFAMGAFRGVVYDHYLYLLLPAVCVLIAVVLRYLERVIPSVIMLSIVGIVLVHQLSQTDVNIVGRNDIARTDELTKKMVEYSGSEPFAFTLVNSRSFSDLHYRFYLKKADANVVPIKSESYKTFFVVCDSDNCKEAFLEQKDMVPVMCYDPHCSGDYGQKEIRNWHVERQYKSPYGAMYQFSRNQL